jgi:hypothetical protein
VSTVVVQSEIIHLVLSQTGSTTVVVSPQEGSPSVSVSVPPDLSLSVTSPSPSSLVVTGPSPASVVVIDPPPEPPVVLVLNRGPRGFPGPQGDPGEGATDIIPYLGMENLFVATLASAFAEYLYNEAGDVSGIDVWEDDTRTLKLFTRTILYSGGEVESVETVYEVTGERLVKTFAFDVNGDIESVTTVVLES